MASLDRYRPPREGYQPPTLPPKPPPRDRQSKSPSRRRDIPPAAPSPPTHSSRHSPPRPVSRRSAPSPARSIPPSPARQIANQQWCFSPDEVASTPSVLDGLTPAEETIRRAKGVNFIYQVGICLQPHSLPQVTLYVAAVFFQRFFMRFSMVEEKGGIHHYNIAATAVFLANKTEENCFKTKNIIIAVAKVAQKNKDLIIDEQSKEYWRWRDSILMYEELMLEILTFDLMVANPYEQLYNYLTRLDLHRAKDLRSSAWTFCNDSALTNLPLIMDASDLAIAAIFFASIATKTTIQDINGVEWWNRLGADEKRVNRAIEIMKDTYEHHPLKKTESRLQGSPEFRLENTRRRGETILSQTDAGSSRGGTPMTIDRGTQSPRSRINGRAEPDNEERDKGRSREDEIQNEVQHDRGDSDATLKAVANDLDIHQGKPNGRNLLLSPGAKRKSDELGLEYEGERQQKRARPSDDED